MRTIGITILVIGLILALPGIPLLMLASWILRDDTTPRQPAFWW